MVDGAAGEWNHAGVMRYTALPLFLACVALPALAMKSHSETFPQPCDVIWKASIAVAKTQDYRIVSVSKEEQIISLAAGGAWWGERIISLSLAPGVEHGCTATVQSRYSGIQHSDGPDLLGRIHVQLVCDELGRDSDAFVKFKNCVENSSSNEAKCEAKFRKRVAAASATNTPHHDATSLWNITNP